MNTQNGIPQDGRMRLSPDLIKNSKTITCECGGQVFEEKALFKIISSIISPTGREEIQMIPIIACTKCGLMPEMFDTMGVIPEELKTKKPIV